MTIQERSRPYEKVPSDDRADSLPAIGLSDLLRVLRTRKKTVALTTVIVLAIAAMVVSQLTPRYSANAAVILDQRQSATSNIGTTGPASSDPPIDQTAIATQAQILQSRNLMGRVVDKLNLVEDSEFGRPPPSRLPMWLNPMNWLPADPPNRAPPGADDKRENTIDRVLRTLAVSTQGISAAITIQFTSIDASKAALIANAIADAYVEDQLTIKFATTKSASNWLTERLDQISAQSQAADRAVEQYKATHDLTDATNGPDGLSITQQQLTALSAQLVIAQGELAQQEARFKQVAGMKERGLSADTSAVVASTLISQLRQSEAELLRQEAELSSKYGPLHPKLLDLKSQKENLQAKITQEVARVVDTVGNDVEVARARAQSLEGSLKRLTGQSRTENMARVKLVELSAAAKSSRAIFETLLTQYHEIDGRDSIQTPDARVISKAAVPGAPSFPNKLLFIGAALPGGLLLGFVLAMISDALEAGFRTREQVERALSLPVLSALPELSRLKKGDSPADRVIRKPMSAFTESVRGLQIGLTLGNDGKLPKTIVVTSSVPSEGKTTVAISLARLAAHNGQRVVLVDGDLRRPKLDKTIKLAAWEHGTADALRGNMPVNACLYKDPMSDVMIMPSRPVSNPSDVLSSKAMSNVINVLKDDYDLLIIDTAPLLAVNDARILGLLADAVLFAVRWERTPQQAAIEALRSLADSGVPMAGVVLTRTNTQDYYARRAYGLDKYYRN